MAAGSATVALVPLGVRLLLLCCATAGAAARKTSESCAAKPAGAVGASLLSRKLVRHPRAAVALEDDEVEQDATAGRKGISGGEEGAQKPACMTYCKHYPPNKKCGELKAACGGCHDCQPADATAAQPASSDSRKCKGWCVKIPTRLMCTKMAKHCGGCFRCSDSYRAATKTTTTTEKPTTTTTRRPSTTSTTASTTARAEARATVEFGCLSFCSAYPLRLRCNAMMAQQCGACKQCASLLQEASQTVQACQPWCAGYTPPVACGAFKGFCGGCSFCSALAGTAPAPAAPATSAAPTTTTTTTSQPAIPLRKPPAPTKRPATAKFEWWKHKAFKPTAKCPFWCQRIRWWGYLIFKKAAEGAG